MDSWSPSDTCYMIDQDWSGAYIIILLFTVKQHLKFVEFCQYVISFLPTAVGLAWSRGLLIFLRSRYFRPPGANGLRLPGDPVIIRDARLAKEVWSRLIRNLLRSRLIRNLLKVHSTLSCTINDYHHVHSLHFASNLRLERPAASWGGPFIFSSNIFGVERQRRSTGRSKRLRKKWSECREKLSNKKASGVQHTLIISNNH